MSISSLEAAVRADSVELVAIAIARDLDPNLPDLSARLDAFAATLAPRLRGRAGAQRLAKGVKEAAAGKLARAVKQVEGKKGPLEQS